MGDRRTGEHIGRMVLVGVGIGIALAAVGFFSRLNSSFFVDSVPPDVSVFEWIWVGLNYPARCLYRVWVFSLGLPPKGELVVWFVLPSLAVLLQWTCIGILMGLWGIRRAKQRKEE